MPRTWSRSSACTCPSIRPSQPLRMPTTSTPCVTVARPTTARMTALSPGQSPPAVRTPRTTGDSIQEHRLAGHVPYLWPVLLDVVELVDIDPPHALARGADRHRGVGAAAERHHPARCALE